MSRYRTNTTGYSDGGSYRLIPCGIYEGVITQVSDKLTKNGDFMANVQITITGGEFDMCYVWANIIIPLPDSTASKALGLTKHFLHCIGMPFEGEIDGDINDWLNRSIRFEVAHEQPNQYHSYVKPIVKKYFLKDDITEADLKEDSPL